MTTLRSARPSELPMALAYRILQLRIAVFVVEQRCAYLELDGRDLEAGTRWVWAEQDDDVVAGLRILAEPDGARIGRVVTAAHVRSAGLGRVVMEHALELIGVQHVVLDAQLPLLGWYAGFGFARRGPDFSEDGIVHVPMSRPAAAATG